MQGTPPEEQNPSPVGPETPDETARALDETGFSEETRYVLPRPRVTPDAARPSRPAVPPANKPARSGVPRRADAPPGFVPPVSNYPPPAAPVPPYDPDPYAARRARQRTPPSESGVYLPWWSLVILVGVVAIAAFGTMALISSMGQAAAPGNQPSRVQVITAMPTLSQEFIGGSGGASAPQLNGAQPDIPQAQATATALLPTPIPSPSLPPGEFAVGTRVTVVGVGLSGLNVRSAPGYSGSQRFLAYDDDIFALVDGPQESDGIEWWQIEDPDDPERQGWAARNYLEAVGN